MGYRTLVVDTVDHARVPLFQECPHSERARELGALSVSASSSWNFRRYFEERERNDRIFAQARSKGGQSGCNPEAVKAYFDQAARAYLGFRQQQGFRLKRH
jgi:hypothetical protein